MALRTTKRALAIGVSVASITLAQNNLPQQITEILRNLPSEILKYREILIKFFIEHQVHFLTLGIAIPLFILIYFDAKLFYRLLRDITYLILRRKEMLPIEKKWYSWRISMKVVGIVILSIIIIVMAGWLAWVLQFKNLKELVAAMEELRKKQNPFQILETLLRSLRRR